MIKDQKTKLITHNLQNNLLSIIASLDFVEKKILLQNYSGALETIKLIREMTPIIKETIYEIEDQLMKS